MNFKELEQISAGRKAAVRFIIRNFVKSAKFYGGLAGGLSAGERFSKAALEAGKNAGIVNDCTGDCVRDSDESTNKLSFGGFSEETTLIV